MNKTSHPGTVIEFRVGRRVERVGAKSLADRPPNPVALALGVVAAMCLLALARMPYGYYIFLRWAVCAAAISGAIVLLRGRARVLPVVLFGLALLFNPIALVGMRRESWVFVDMAAAGLLGWAGIVVYGEER